MVQVFIRIIIRQFTRNRALHAINVLGLTIALTVAILVYGWVHVEFGYDRYHDENERTFAILVNTKFEGEIETSDEFPVGLKDFLETDVPEIEALTRVDGTQCNVEYHAKQIQQYGVYADNDFFKVFNRKIISGNPSGILNHKNSIVVSQRTAHMLFDDGQAVGSEVSINKATYTVIGVFENFPVNSSYQSIAFVLPFHAKTRDSDDWRATFVKLYNASSREAVEEKIASVLRKTTEDETITPFLFCLTDWRLHWSFENGKISGGRIVYVVNFSLIAIFILVMACVNYMNIATAGASRRAREIGIRKVNGATRGILAFQFILESLTITSIAAVLSLILAYLLLPMFNQVTGSAIQFSLTNPALLIGLGCITLCTGLMAGSYPAWILSSLRPATILRGDLHAGIAGAGVRQKLVVFQFTLSVLLIFCALILHQQINFMLRKDLGFDKENILILDGLSDPDFPLQSFKTAMMARPVIHSVGGGDSSPIEINGSGEVKAVNTDQTVVFNGASVDEDFLPTVGLKFIQGRNFSPSIPDDSVNFIITAKGAELLGFQDPIGQLLRFDMYHSNEGKIIGVIQDFHNEDIHAPANPVIFTYRSKPEGTRIFVRYQKGQHEAALKHTEEVFHKFRPEAPLLYGFLDQDFENQFHQERLFRKFTFCFTLIGIAIACLGLVGLAVYTTGRRAKEIAVRKVMGATVIQIMTFLYSDFLKPVMVSFLIAFPIGYYFMSRFLEVYPFRISISMVAFGLVALVMIGIVIVTVSFQSLQAAKRNPIDSLRE